MGNPIRGYRNLVVWRRALPIAEQTYLLSRSFPPDEQFGLTSQTRRAAVSIAANIAEGEGRGPRAAYASFVRIAQGWATKAGWLDVILSEADELGRMLGSLLTRLASDSRPEP